MPLIKRTRIHQGNSVIRVHGSEGVSAQAIDNYTESSRPLFSEEDYQRRMSEIVSSANGEAQKIRSLAEEEARRVMEQAREEGQKAYNAERERGFQEGRQEAFKQMDSNIHESRQVIEQAKQQRNAIIRSAVPEILKLAVKIAGNVVKTEITQNKEIIMHIIRDAIEKISDNEQVVIKVSHQDLQTVRDNKESIVDLVEAKNLSIVPDKHALEGGCVIETKLGYIDARIVTKLEMIEEAILSVYEEEKIKKETVLKEKVERGEQVNIEEEEAKEITELQQIVSDEETPTQNKGLPENLENSEPPLSF